MRRSVGRSSLFGAAITGLVLVLSSSNALAQGKGDKPAGKPAPAEKQAAPPKDAKPVPPKPPPPKKPMTPAQKSEAAKKLFVEGKAKFDSGDFAGAYLAFKEADELLPNPPVPKFRMAECLDKQGDVEGAIKAYEAFLAAKPRPDEDKNRIETSNARIAALKVAPADVKVVIQPAEAAAAQLTIDGAPAQGNPLKVPPGKHTIGAKMDGYEDGKVEVDVTRGEKKEVSITLTAKPKDVAADKPTDKPADKPADAPKPPAETSGGSSVIPAAVTLSLAGAGVVVGAVFGGLALKSKGEYEDGPTQDLFDETERNALIADMSFGVALTFGVTGLVLLLTDSGGEEPAPAEKPAEKKANLFVAPFAGPSGAGAVGVVTF